MGSYPKNIYINSTNIDLKVDANNINISDFRSGNDNFTLDIYLLDERGAFL